MHIPNHLIQRNPCGNHTMESHLCPKISIANDKTQSSVLKYQSIARDKNSIVSVIPPTINDFLASLVTKESIEMNELPVIGSLCLRDDLSRKDPDPCVCANVSGIATGQTLQLARKSFIWTSKQPFAIHCLPTSCNVCRVAIPKILVQTQGSGSFRAKGHLATSRENE